MRMREKKMTQFVWFYVPGPDNGLELRLSMASVRKNFPDEAKITVVGDKPPWYEGHFIPVRQFSGVGDSHSRKPFRDTQHKIMQCAVHPEIDEQFVWIMDDCYMLKPTPIEAIGQFRYDPWYRRNNRRDWHQLIGKTFDALVAAGRPTLQAGTHLPHVFEKAKLTEMFGRYGFPKNLLLFEILYENTWQNAAEAIPYGGSWKGVQYPQFLRRLLRPATIKELNAIDANFLNYQSNVWQATMRDWLMMQFSEG
jgi:hypothetical protein